MTVDASVVIDDDPTGTQAMRDVRALLEWSPERVRTELAGAPSVHLMTNARALPAEQAEALTADAAASARVGAPHARIVLRGDSTLRGHVLEEYRAVAGGSAPVLLLVPALPAAGRTTRAGVHLVARDGGAVPLHETEYARDGGFAYSSARLLDWAHERSAGVIDRDRGTEVPLERVRASHGAAVAEALAHASRSGLPAACAPDAETAGDLELIAAGLRRAEAAGVPVVTRCAPAFAGILTGRLADGLVEPHDRDGGVLVVCGSYVPATTAQLEALRGELGIAAIELDPRELADPAASRPAVAAAAARADEALSRSGVAVVATARERPAGLRSLDTGMRIAGALAGIVPAVRSRVGVVVAKGGITSHVTLREGLGATAATVLGPLLPGVALWRADGDAGAVSYVVVPGNVGGPRLLVELLARLGVAA